MREIKFRGISQYSGKMIYGQLLRGDNNFSIVIDFGMISTIQLEPIVKGTQSQYTGLKDVNGVEIYEGDIIRHTENVRVGTTRSRRGRSRKYDTFAVYGDREVISVVRFDVFENTLGFITSTNSNTAYDSYFFGEGKRTDKPDLYIQNLTDRLNVKKEYEVTGNIYENKELLEEK